ncbi:MAG: polysaccharide pyruvyl transferase family protein [Candidatus Gracilibacteria bacterium]|nr:polysaccharide pyruvyl transferase family protein [Candidatus Gracilibacteria bacterium]
MKISVFASIGAQNLGDELILKNEIKILEEKYSKKLNIDKKDIIFNIFTYDLKNNFYISDNVEYIEYFPIDIKKIKNIFRNIFNFLNFLKITIQSDLVFIGGGGIIYDNELQSVGNPLKQWLFRTNIFKVFNKKVEFFRVGINIKNNKNLDLVKNIFSCASEISVRDKYSFNLLQKLNFNNIELLEDPVFSDRDFKNNPNPLSGDINKKYLISDLKISELNVQNIKNIIKNNNINLEGKKIGLSLRRQNIKDYKKNILEIIKHFLENKSEIILIPHSFHKTDELANDYIFFQEINGFLSTEGFSPLNICKTMQESYNIYTNKKIDLNLASRLHSIILSQVYEIDFISISYSTKTDEVISYLSNQN